VRDVLGVAGCGCWAQRSTRDKWRRSRNSIRDELSDARRGHFVPRNELGEDGIGRCTVRIDCDDLGPVLGASKNFYGGSVRGGKADEKQRQSRTDGRVRASIGADGTTQESIIYDAYGITRSF
jgi:hypothetical protein